MMMQSIKFQFILLLTFVNLFNGCAPSNKANSTQNPKDSEAVSSVGQSKGQIVVSPQEFKQMKGDPYQTIGCSFRNNSLFVKIKYGGGCGKTNLSVCWNGVTSEDTRFFKLVFQDNDNCRAFKFLEKEFKLDRFLEKGNPKKIRVIAFDREFSFDLN